MTIKVGVPIAIKYLGKLMPLPLRLTKVFMPQLVASS